MNRTAMNRVLEKSPADSLAAMSTSSFLRGDTTELHRIYAALPAHGRASRHEFIVKHHAMTESILLWSVEYWKTVATINSCLAVSVAANSGDDERPIAAFLVNAHKAKQATLIEAMRRICDRMGIAFEDIAAFAEVDTDIDAQPIPKLIPEYVELFGVGG